MDTAPQWGGLTRGANLSIDHIEPTFIFTPKKIMDSVIYSHFRAIKHTVYATSNQLVFHAQESSSSVSESLLTGRQLLHTERSE